MSLNNRPLVASFVLFVSILVGATFLLGSVESLTTAQRLGFIPLPYYLLGFVFCLSLLLNRSRELGVAMALLIIYFCIQKELQLPLEEVRPASVYFLLSAMAPIGFVLLALIPEQRSRDFWGIASFIIAPLFAVIGMRILDASLSNEFDKLDAEAVNAGLINDSAVNNSENLELGLSQVWLTRADIPTIISSEGFALFISCLIFCILIFFWRRTLSQLALTFCLGFSFITLNLLYVPMISTVMIIAGGLTLLSSLATHVFGMLYQDELTGIPNRKALNKAVASVREGDVVVMADIDRFKKINDTYGHDTGDEILKLVASLLIKTKYARVFRYGGEEFSLIFKKSSADEVAEALNKTRQAISDYEFIARSSGKRLAFSSKSNLPENERTPINTSISMGAVTLLKGESPTDALIRADEQLYKAKKGGRNKVYVNFDEAVL